MCGGAASGPGFILVSVMIQLVSRQKYQCERTSGNLAASVKPPPSGWSLLERSTSVCSPGLRAASCAGCYPCVQRHLGAEKHNCIT